MAHLSTSITIYLVEFNGVSQQFFFNDETGELGNLIQQHGKYGIVSLKQYHPHKGAFKKLSKRDIVSWFSWDTHSTEQLKKVNFI